MAWEQFQERIVGALLGGLFLNFISLEQFQDRIIGALLGGLFLNFINSLGAVSGQDCESFIIWTVPKLY
jgi:hypothetical protein